MIVAVVDEDADLGVAQLERQFGFDKPPLERFGLMVWNFVRFDFGESYFRSISVIDSST